MRLDLVILLSSSVLFTIVSSQQWDVVTGDGGWSTESNATRLFQGSTVLHRSHKYGNAELMSCESGPCARTMRNLESCAGVTVYYDDAALDAAVDAAVAEMDGADRLESALRLLRSEPLASIFVLRADIARLALLWHRGGFWVDADVYCEEQDELSSLLDTISPDKCVLAWEGEVGSGPLNWAMGCPRGHGLLLEALDVAASRVEKWALNREWPPGASPDDGALLFRARDSVGNSVPVLQLTGPAMLGDALLQWLQRSSVLGSLREFRVANGELEEDSSTWARPSFAPGLVVLPYCFFRSKGCEHLQGPPWFDKVVFHHEFDTSWRTAHWHNYYEQQPTAPVQRRRRHARRVDWPSEEEAGLLGDGEKPGDHEHPLEEL